MYEIGEMVVCKRNQHNKWSGRKVSLTKGKSYKVVGARLNEVEVVNDAGDYLYYANHRFKAEDTELTEEELREFEKNLREIENSPE